MDAKIEIPCEICYGVVITTVYVVIGKYKSDGSSVPLRIFLHEDKARVFANYARKKFKKCYSCVYVYPRVLCL